MPKARSQAIDMVVKAQAVYTDSAAFSSVQSSKPYGVFWVKGAMAAQSRFAQVTNL